MLHGIIFARHARGLSSDPAAICPTKYGVFASGTGLQELYVSPDLLTPQNWDLIARARAGAQAHRGAKGQPLAGRRPARDEVYGWAAWSPEHSVIALRNPSSRRSGTLSILLRVELPKGAARKFSAKACMAAAASGLDANRVTLLRLAPHSSCLGLSSATIKITLYCKVGMPLC